MENFEEQDDTLSISENLDENGFPSEEFSEENGVFASDFYGSGTDWSSLVIDSNKKLKQSNLFQMWGINNKPSSSSSSSSEHQSSNLKQSNLFQIWGINKKKPSASDSRKNETLIQGSGIKRKGNDRACPFYKKIPGTPFSVDAFRYGLIEGCSAYFLSHFHYDHYGGLSKGWSHGPIYCTPVTARLVKMCLSVNPSFICPLELNVEHNINGVRVTMLEANHCPGAALIHFRLIDGRCYLHTGDFRASKSMQSYPLLASRRINLLYLDTTYCNPKYRFPSKEDVLAFVVKIAKQSLEKQPKTLIIVGAYSIGKECVYLAISEALQIKIHTNASRRRVLESFGWQELTKKLSSHGHDTPLHVLPLSTLRHENLKKYMETYGSRYTTVLAFGTTGWTYSETSGNKLDLIRPNCRGNITIYGVPYSEHSSFLEMREFVQFLKPDKIIPTVNVGNAGNRDKMQSYFREWMK